MKHFIKNYWVLNVIFMVDKENFIFSRFSQMLLQDYKEKRVSFVIICWGLLLKIKNSGKLYDVIKLIV